MRFSSWIAQHRPPIWLSVYQVATRLLSATGPVPREHKAFEQGNVCEDLEPQCSGQVGLIQLCLLACIENGDMSIVNFRCAVERRIAYAGRRLNEGLPKGGRSLADPNG